MTPFAVTEPDPQLNALLTGYPDGLFSTRLFQSIELLERYGLETLIAIAHRLQLPMLLDHWQTAETVCQRGGFDRRIGPAIAGLLRHLAAEGLIEHDGSEAGNRYRLTGSLRADQCQGLHRLGLAIDPANAATLALYDAAGNAYPSVARGEVSGEEALFGLGQVGLWLDYFNNTNPGYAINNRITAIAAADRLADRPEIRILEVGAGAGSAAAALLAELSTRGWRERIVSYRITEPHPFFRRRGQRSLSAEYRDLPLEFAALDIDQPWQAQGAGPGDYDLIYTVNALHVAQDIGFSLDQARTALADGGWLIAGECLRPDDERPVAIELVFRLLDSFNRVRTDPVIRPQPGFLTPRQWLAGFEQVDLSDCRIDPDPQPIRAVYPRFVTGAVCGRR